MEKEEKRKIGYKTLNTQKENDSLNYYHLVFSLEEKIFKQELYVQLIHDSIQQEQDEWARQNEFLSASPFFYNQHLSNMNLLYTKLEEERVALDSLKHNVIHTTPPNPQISYSPQMSPKKSTNEENIIQASTRVPSATVRSYQIYSLDTSPALSSERLDEEIVPRKLFTSKSRHQHSPVRLLPSNAISSVSSPATLSRAHSHILPGSEKKNLKSAVKKPPLLKKKKTNQTRAKDWLFNDDMPVLFDIKEVLEEPRCRKTRERKKIPTTESFPNLAAQLCSSINSLDKSIQAHFSLEERRVLISSSGEKSRQWERSLLKNSSIHEDNTIIMCDCNFSTTQFKKLSSSLVAMNAEVRAIEIEQCQLLPLQFSCLFFQESLGSVPNPLSVISWPVLTKLCLPVNSLCDATVIKIGRLLSRDLLPSLEYLELGCNKITNKGIISLMNGIKTRVKQRNGNILKYLGLSGNLLSDEILCTLMGFDTSSTNTMALVLEWEQTQQQYHKGEKYHPTASVPQETNTSSSFTSTLLFLLNKTYNSKKTSPGLNSLLDECFGSSVLEDSKKYEGILNVLFKGFCPSALSIDLSLNQFTQASTVALSLLWIIGFILYYPKAESKTSTLYRIRKLLSSDAKNTLELFTNISLNLDWNVIQDLPTLESLFATELMGVVFSLLSIIRNKSRLVTSLISLDTTLRGIHEEPNHPLKTILEHYYCQL